MLMEVVPHRKVVMEAVLLRQIALEVVPLLRHIDMEVVPLRLGGPAVIAAVAQIFDRVLQAVFYVSVLPAVLYLGLLIL